MGRGDGASSAAVVGEGVPGPSGLRRPSVHLSDDEDEEEDVTFIERVPVYPSRKVVKKSSSEGKGPVRTPAQKKMMTEVSIKKKCIPIIILYFLNLTFEQYNVEFF